MLQECREIQVHRGGTCTLSNWCLQKINFNQLFSSGERNDKTANNMRVCFQLLEMLLSTFKEKAPIHLSTVGSFKVTMH